MSDEHSLLGAWEILHEEIPYENRWVRVRLQQLRLPSGHDYDYTLVDRPAQGVAVLLFDGAGRLLLEREYRHGVGQVIWQLPGGLVDPEESPLASIQRELLEESGYEGQRWQSLGSFYDNPALGNAATLLFMAQQARRVAEPQWDEAEALELHWVTMAWLREAVRRGEIVDRVILSGLALLWAHGRLPGTEGS